MIQAKASGLPLGARLIQLSEEVMMMEQLAASRDVVSNLVDTQVERDEWKERAIIAEQ